MEKPSSMTAEGARVWCVMNPMQNVVHENGNDVYRFNLKEARFEWYDKHIQDWRHDDSLYICDADCVSDFYIKSEFDAWKSPPPETTVLENMLREEIGSIFGLKSPPPLSQDDVALCRAVTAWVERKLRESKA